MSDTLADLCHALLDAARAAGADQADAMALNGQSLSIDIRGGSLEQAERAEGTDIGLRVLIGQRQATVSASDTKAATLREMAQRAVAMAQEAPQDPYIGLADPDQLATNPNAAALELYDSSPEPAPTTLQDMAARAEAAALDVVGISQVQSASAGWGRRDVYIAATNGFSGGYARSSHSVSCVAIAGTGADMERDYDGDSRIFGSDLRDAAEIGTCAAQRAVARMGARKPRTGAYPILFDERISGSLISHLLGAIHGSAIARGSSWLRDALGEQVLPSGISVVEDPHRSRATGSRPFDAEGLPTARRTIVENGILTGWTLDLTNARKLGMQSTANAVRGPGSAPSPGNYNIALTQGEKSPTDLMAEMGTGLLVTSMIGSTINPNTGDYSRGASGIWIENGLPAYPVNECTIAGNLRDMLMHVTPSNDARTHLSQVVPSLLVEGLTLAGD